MTFVQEMKEVSGCINSKLVKKKLEDQEEEENHNDDSSSGSSFHHFTYTYPSLIACFALS